VETDERLMTHNSIKSAAKSLKHEQQQAAVDHLFKLKMQGEISKCMTETVEPKQITIWATTMENVPSFIFNFARKAMLQVLPTASNLFRWKRALDPSCPLCTNGKPQTNKHVLSNCGSAAALHRYTIRHNEVLSIIVQWLSSTLAAGQKLYADLPDAQVLPVRDLFTSFRPDIAVCDNKSINALELTICHETNFVSSRAYKQTKYNSLAQCGSTLASNKRIVPYFIEVSTLGFISNMSDFTKAMNIPNMPNKIRHRITSAVLMSSFKLYCNRNLSASTV
jgi:hypothetical protein